MGGRGSMGGTRSTYRGNSTELFQQQQNNSSNNGGGGGGGGSGGTSNGGGNTSTGGVQNGGGGSSSGGGGSTATVNQQQPQINLDVFRKKDDDRRETDEQIAADVVAVNPRWGEDNGEWDINCQRCANAVEFRARGYDVTARSVLEGDHSKTWNGTRFSTAGADQYDIAAQWVDENGDPGVWVDFNGGGRQAIQDGMEAEIVSWGEGARGLVLTQWTGGGSHIFNVEVRNGKPFYIDGQINQYGDNPGTWKEDFSARKEQSVMRIDNLSPTDSALTWVRERTVFEKNAPSRAELDVELDRVWPVDGTTQTANKRVAFLKAWNLVRKGKAPTPEPIIAATPYILQAFNDGLAWTRRPD